MGEFEEVKAAAPLKVYAESKLRRNARREIVCPYCGSGGHGTARSDSAFKIKDDHFHCFSCESSGDVFDLAAQVEGIDPGDKRAQLEAVAEWANYPLSERATVASNDGSGIVAKSEQPRADYAEGRAREASFIEAAQAAEWPSEAVRYMESRGYSEEQARALGIGWDAAHRRIVLPWKGSDYYHIDRDVTGSAPNKYLKPKTDDVGEQPLYNPDALKANAFFVVEGVFDALAVEACGFEAVALGGTGARSIVAALSYAPSKPLPIIMLDADGEGEKAAGRLAGYLEEAHVAYRIASAEGRPRGKDPDEMRANDPAGFGALLAREYEAAVAERAERSESAYREALRSLRVLSPSDVATDLYTLVGALDPVPTGFERFDGEVGGGFPRGLCVLGAVSSLGKTTLALQMADQIAARGVPVLFVTIEQSARELVAKSLSRYMWRASDGRRSPTAAEISNPRSRSSWGMFDDASLMGACEAYSRDVSKSLHILEGDNQPGVSDVRTVAERIAAHDGAAPVVFIDYLQLMRPQGERDTDKQAVDKNVMSLRQLARDLRTPVVAISSLNRSSYGGTITLDSFKESGAIEYGADLLLGLQPSDMGGAVDAASDEKAAKRAANNIMKAHKSQTKRDCEIMVLKNRNGRTPSSGIAVEFDALHSTFTEK